MRSMIPTFRNWWIMNEMNDTEDNKWDTEYKNMNRKHKLWLKDSVGS